MSQSIEMLNKLRIYKFFSSFYTHNAMEQVYIAARRRYVLYTPNVSIT